MASIVEPTVHLVSSEGDRFVVPVKIAIVSGTVKDIIKEDDDDDDEEEIDLQNVSTATLVKVIDFMNLYDREKMNDIEKPLRSDKMEEVVQVVYSEFVVIDQEKLFDLILAANYMHIQPLLDLTCAKVASMIKGKSPEEIRATFNIINDFTPEEEDKIREDNRWVEEA